MVAEHDHAVTLMKEAFPLNDRQLQLGGVVWDDHLIAPCTLALTTLNRHGLIAGATGTGKTKTIQMFCEQLSRHGVPSLVMDMKGDLSGLAKRGQTDAAITARQARLNVPYVPRQFSVNLMAMGNAPGIPIRIQVQTLGALLFARMLALNETQTAAMHVLFQFAEENQLLLVDLDDMQALIKHARAAGKVALNEKYGGIADATLVTMLRKIVVLAGQGGAHLFGTPAFVAEDLLGCNANGEGVISVMRLMTLQQQPQLFSTMMLGLLTLLDRALPEVGDLAKPKLVVVIDEAHLLFDGASNALETKIKTLVKLIRSKGVGVFFATQNAGDLPDSILSQLGLKIQHALRAFTAKDRTNIKRLAENFPESTLYDVDDLLTSLGIGEALVTGLNAKGQPTPLAHVLLRAPESRMGPLTASEVDACCQASPLFQKYNQHAQLFSAKDKLSAEPSDEKVLPKSKARKVNKKPDGWEQLSKNTLVRQIIRNVFKQVTAAVLVLLGLKKK